MNLSILILVKNEEEIIDDCLRNLKFANEIIVLDQNSTDKTVEIAKKYTNKVYKTKTEDFAKNRTRLKDLAVNKWVLYVDADERYDQAVIQEVEMAMLEDKSSGFYVPRRNYVLGVRIKHGGWWPDYAPRLFKKEDLIKWQGEIHESPVVNGTLSYFKNPIDHFTARNVSLMLGKSIKWARVEANLYHQNNNKKVTILRVIKAFMTEFVNRYLFKKAFLDGTIGLIEAIFQAYHKAMIFTYLWEKQNKVEDKFKSEYKKVI